MDVRAKLYQFMCDTGHVTLRAPPLGLPGGDTGGVKKTSPMKGKVFFTGDIRTDTHTHGHRDSMTESAQWADSVKTKPYLAFAL